LDSILALLNSKEAVKKRRGILLLALNPTQTNLLLIKNIAGYDESLSIRFFARRVLKAIENTHSGPSDEILTGLINHYIQLENEAEKKSFIKLRASKDYINSTALLSLLLSHEKNTAVICFIITSLGECGGEADIRRIASFNGDNRFEIRRAVFDALLSINSIKTYPFLTQFIIDDNYSLASDARNFFKSLNAQLASKVINFMVSSGTDKMKVAAAAAAGLIICDEIFNELNSLILSESPRVKAAALNSLNMFIEAGFEPAVEFMGESSDGLIETAAETLFNLKTLIEIEKYIESPKTDSTEEPPAVNSNECIVHSKDSRRHDVEIKPRPEVEVSHQPAAARAFKPTAESVNAETAVEDNSTGPNDSGASETAVKKAAAETAAGSNLPETAASGEVCLFPLESNSRFGYIDSNARLVIPFSFIRAYPFSSGLAAVMSGISWGYIDQAGNFVITAQFEAAYNFCDNLARVFIAKLYGFINEKGQLVIKAKYEDARDFSEDLAAVRYEGNWNFINAQGREQFKKLDYERAASFKNGFAMVRKNKKFGFINKKGEPVIKCAYEMADDFSEGVACVKTSSKFGYIDGTDKFVIKPQFDKAREFCGGLAAVEMDRHYGFIDAKGKILIKPQYEYAANFNEGLAAVKINELWGFINTAGETVIKAEFAEAGPFINGLAYVRNGETFNYINKKGELIYNESPAGTAGEIKMQKEINKNLSIQTATIHALMQRHGYLFSNWKSGASGHPPQPKSVEYYFLKASSGLNKTFNYTEIMDLIDAIRREHANDVANELIKFLETNYSV